MKKQLTLLFHIDDLLLSHGKSHAVTNYIKLLDAACVKNDLLTMTRGKLHEHLVATLDFREKGSVIFTQHDAIKNFWMSFPEELREACRLTPAPEHLFKVGTKSLKLDAKRLEECHAATAKVLCFGQRTRVDLQVSSGRYCTRAKELLEQECIKFKHLSGHAWATRFLPLTFSIGENLDVITCVYGVRAVYNDGRGHSGLFLTMVQGAMMNASKKLGLVTTSCTET